MMGGDLDLGNGQSMAWFGGNAAVYYSAQPKQKTAQQQIDEFNATMADLKKHMGHNPNESLSGSTTTDFFTQKPDESLKDFEVRMFDFCKNGKAELNSR